MATQQARIMAALDRPKSSEQLAKDAGVPKASLYAALTSLRAADRVTRTADGLYARIAKTTPPPSSVPKTEGRPLVRPAVRHVGRSSLKRSVSTRKTAEPRNNQVPEKENAPAMPEIRTEPREIENSNHPSISESCRAIMHRLVDVQLGITEITEEELVMLRVLAEQLALKVGNEVKENRPEGGEFRHTDSREGKAA